MSGDLYADYAAAEEYLNDPSLPDETRKALIGAMSNMSRQIARQQRVAARDGHHNRPADIEDTVNALMAANLAKPSAPVGDDPEYAQAVALDDAKRRTQAMLERSHPEWLPEGPSLGERAGGFISGLGGALLDAAPEMAEYATPVAGNLKGAQDFGSTFDQYLTARDADPISALAYVPQLASDAAQALIPISAFTGSIRGAGNALNRARNYITKAW